MGSSVAMMMNNCAWPVILVCLSHLGGDNKYCKEESCIAGEGCLLPGHSWGIGKDDSLRLTGHGTIVGDYMTKKSFTIAMWSDPTDDSKNVYFVKDSSAYKEVEELLNRITGLSNATKAGLENGEIFVTSFGKFIEFGILSIMSITLTDLPTLNYGVISDIVFRQTSCAISEDNFSKITADTTTALTKLKDALNHLKDEQSSHYIDLLKESEKYALQVYNRVATISFPPEFEWWRPIIYMQLATVRIIALLNLYTIDKSTGFLDSAKQCHRDVKLTSNTLVSDSASKLKDWFIRDIVPKFDSSEYKRFIEDDERKMNNLKKKFEEMWDKELNIFNPSIKEDL